MDNCNREIQYTVKHDDVADNAIEEYFDVDSGEYHLIRQILANPDNVSKIVTEYATGLMA